MYCCVPPVESVCGFGVTVIVDECSMLTEDQRYQLRTRLAQSDAPVGVVAVMPKP